MPEVASEGTRVNRTMLRLIRDDITDLDVDAFVFYAQPDLALGSGFGTAISVRGGATVQKELEELAPVATGEAVVTGAGNLKARQIIHAVGPRFQEEDTESKLRATLTSVLRLAEKEGVKRLALPAMGAGYYGIPPELCARVMADTISNHLQDDTGLEEVIICVLDSRQHDAFAGPLSALS
jgi:O-acetyl-ADP-ribose deacetylase (regulator of RNase III)